MVTFRKRNIPYALLGLCSLCAPLLLNSGYQIHILVTTGIFIILVSGLDLVIGYVGALSLAQQTFLGIGAYTSALLAMKLEMSFFPSLLSAAFISGLAGFLIGAVCLRLRSHFFILVTVAFAMIAEIVCTNWVDLTNGPMGLAGIPPAVINLEFTKYTLATKTQSYYFILAMAALMVFLKHRIVNSRVGRSFKVIRENEELGKSIGVNTFAYSLLAFVISSMYAGVAGSFYAHYINFLSPDIFGFSYMLTMLVMLALGGKGTTGGPVIGAIVVSFLPEYLRVLSEYRLPIFGILLVILTIYMPEGIICQLKPAVSGTIKLGGRVWHFLK